MTLKSLNFFKFMFLKDSIYIMNIKLFILLSCLCKFNLCFAFDVKLMISKNAFVYEKYNFSIVKVIDARISPSTPTGFFFQGALIKKFSVGNDSLDKELAGYFKKNQKSFHEPTTKMILVINQLNLTEIRYKNIDDFEFTLAFDYYRVVDNTAKLEYSQFIKYDKGAGINKENSIVKGFSEAMAFAFLQFKNQIMYYKPLAFTPILTEDLTSSLTRKLVKRIVGVQLNDGIFFNINQLLKNAPVITSGYSLAKDSALQKAQPVTIECKTYLAKKAFALVEKQQLYIYISDGIYLPGEIDDNGSIFLKDLYYKKKYNVLNTSWVYGLRAFIPLLALASDISEFVPKGELIKVQIDDQTGQLRL